MTPQQEQDLLKYVHTHGKQARCWHSLVDDDVLMCELCGLTTDGYEVVYPVLSADYLFQRCEEEGFTYALNSYVGPNITAAIWTGGADKFGDPIRVFAQAETPQHALLIATARALGWEGEVG